MSAGHNPGYWQCPRCQLELTAETIDGLHMHVCTRCGGTIVEAQSLAYALANADTWPALAARSDALHHAAEVEVDGRRMQYLDCPCCSGPTSRRNFARVSGVMVDVCMRCGTWFDQGELREALDFIGRGGMTQTAEFQAREAQHQKEQRRAIRDIERRTTQWGNRSRWRW